MSRSQRPHSAASPSVDIDGFESVSNAGLAALRAGLDHKRALTDDAKLSCAQCKTQENTKTPLQACSRCRSARYCSKKCQQVHYKSTHKRDCAAFKDPPLCRAFNYDRILPGCVFPERPIFSRGHCSGMGGWVSSGGSITCSLASMAGGVESYQAMRSEEPSVEQLTQLMSMIPGATAGKFLTITVLVQNRIPKATPMVVVGKAMVAVGSPKGTPILMQGKAAGEQPIMLEKPDLGRVIGMPVVTVKLTHFNGKEVKEGKSFPAIKDPSSCAILLHLGDYAMFEVEFRCGGPNVTLDFQALGLIDHIVIPFVPFDINFDGSYLELLQQTSEKDAVCEVHAKIDQQAVGAWYEDYTTKGERAYIVSHYGEARANMLSSGDKTFVQMLSMMAGM